MASFSRAGQRLLCLLVGLPLGVSAQPAYQPQGAQYPIVGSLPGDQVNAQIALAANAGVVVWQDNATDEDGFGISARRLNSGLSGSLGAFRVNELGAGDQENPQVALLKDGGAVFVWHGGVNGIPDIYARFLKADGTFATGDIRVNTFIDGPQIGASVAALKDGNVAVVWSSYQQDGSFYGVYGQRLSPSGEKLGPEFRVNQTTSFSQKNPSIVALANGNFVVAWVSERPLGVVNATDEAGQAAYAGAGAVVHKVDVVGTVFSHSGDVLSTEFLLNASTNNCANPQLTANGDGGFSAVWSAWNETRNALLVGSQKFTNGWDVFYRSFGSDGTGVFPEVRVNAYFVGDQFAPRIGGQGPEHFVLWSSLAQEGFEQGVYGQIVLANSGQLLGSEFRVNTTTSSAQLAPCVAADAGGGFLGVWSSFTGGNASYDLTAQRFASSLPLIAPPPPYVSALSQTKLSVTWAEFTGYPISRYELYVDHSGTPIAVTGNSREITQLVAGSSHTFRLAYQLTDGRVSPLSAQVTGKTWSEDDSFDGLPDDWQKAYWGQSQGDWPAANVDSDGDGASNLREFLAGTSPIDASSVLKTQIAPTNQGQVLIWNSQAGVFYQVQVTSDFVSWTSLGAPRLAAGTTDSVAVDGSKGVAYYRVVRIR